MEKRERGKRGKPPPPREEIGGVCCRLVTPLRAPPSRRAQGSPFARPPTPGARSGVDPSSAAAAVIDDGASAARGARERKDEALAAAARGRHACAPRRPSLGPRSAHLRRSSTAKQTKKNNRRRMSSSAAPWRATARATGPSSPAASRAARARAAAFGKRETEREPRGERESAPAVPKPAGRKKIQEKLTKKTKTKPPNHQTHPRLTQLAQPAQPRRPQRSL